MKRKQYYYLTNCVCSYAKDIDDMVERARCITYKTFRKYVDIINVEKMFGYNKHLRIKDDYAVSFYRSKFKGNLCYYLQHSAIEYIFIQERD